MMLSPKRTRVNLPWRPTGGGAQTHLQASAYSGLTGVVVWVNIYNRIEWGNLLTDRPLSTAIHESLQWYTVDLHRDAGMDIENQRDLTRHFGEGGREMAPTR